MSPPATSSSSEAATVQGAENVWVGEQSSFDSVSVRGYSRLMESVGRDNSKRPIKPNTRPGPAPSFARAPKDSANLRIYISLDRHRNRDQLRPVLKLIRAPFCPAAPHEARLECGLISDH